MGTGTSIVVMGWCTPIDVVSFLVFGAKGGWVWSGTNFSAFNNLIRPQMLATRHADGKEKWKTNCEMSKTEATVVTAATGIK